MSKGQIAGFSVIALVAAMVLYLSVRNRQAPPLPDDRDHARFVSSVACLGCHGPGTVSPQSKNHPIANDCTRCHPAP